MEELALAPGLAAKDALTHLRAAYDSRTEYGHYEHEEQKYK